LPLEIFWEFTPTTAGRPVATGTMRKLLRTERMRALREAHDGDDGGGCLVSTVGSGWWVVSRGERRRAAAGRQGRNFGICAGTRATMGKGSADVLEK
jgi:hypothetical protein